MNRSELIFNLLSIPMDLVALISASIVAFYLRLHSERFVGPVLYQLTLNDLLTVILKVAPILILVFALLSLYKLRGTRRFIHEFNRIIVGTSLSVLFAIVLFFFNQSIFPSRFIILVAWFLGTLFILIGRLILKRVQEFFFTHNYGLHRLVVINGQGSEAEVIQRFLLNPSHGYKVVGELTNSDRVVSELEELVSRDGNTKTKK
jgi:FlaA1/EpsC-like NDP-sugar epimerase